MVSDSRSSHNMGLILPLFRHFIEFACTVVFYVMAFACATLVLPVYVLYKLFYTPLWPLVVLYVGWTILLDWNTPKRGGRPISFMRNLPVFKYVRDYYPITLEKTADLDPTKNYIFGYHPHGLIGVGAVVSMQTEALGFSHKYPGIIPHLSVISHNMRTFIYRSLLMSLGIIDVGKESLRYVLTQMGPGHSVVIIIGGASEVIEAGQQDTYHLTLKNRKGFVRLALETGSDIVPVFGFGQNNILTQIGGVGSVYWRLQRWLHAKTKQYNFPITFCCCYGFLGFFPWRTPINVVVGSPIQVTKTPNPTQEQINDLHGQYVDKLKELFNTHREKYHVPSTTQLVFV